MDNIITRFTKFRFSSRISWIFVLSYALIRTGYIQIQLAARDWHAIFFAESRWKNTDNTLRLQSTPVGTFELYLKALLDTCAMLISSTRVLASLLRSELQNFRYCSNLAEERRRSANVLQKEVTVLFAHHVALFKRIFLRALQWPNVITVLTPKIFEVWINNLYGIIKVLINEMNVEWYSEHSGEAAFHRRYYDDNYRECFISEDGEDLSTSFDGRQHCSINSWKPNDRTDFRRR